MACVCPALWNAPRAMRAISYLEAAIAARGRSQKPASGIVQEGAGGGGGGGWFRRVELLMAAIAHACSGLFQK